MKYRKIRFQGLGPFREIVELDLEALDGPLIAVTGRNGSGKSTALELLVGALYRSTPTRGSLRDLATRRDAFVEVELAGGLTIRQMIDAVSGKGETLVKCDGTILVESGKVRDGDAWIAAHLPPPDLTFASTFGVQGSHGFAGLSGADRKAVLLRAIGLERLEVLAAAARERARAAADAFRSCELELGIVRAAAGQGDDLEEQIRELEAARPDLELAVERTAQVLELAKLRGELRRRCLAAEQDLGAHRRDHEAVAVVLAGRPEIEQAIADRAEALAQATELEREAEAVRTVVAGRAAELKAARETWKVAKGRVRELEAEGDGVRARLVERARLERRLEELGDVRARALELDTSRADVREDLAELREDLAAANGTRITGLRTGLERVQAETKGTATIATLALGRDDAARRRFEELPDVISLRASTLRDLETSVDAARRKLRDLEESGRRLEALPDDAAVTALEERLAAARGDVAGALELGELLAPKVKAGNLTAEDLAGKATAVRARFHELDLIASRSSALDRAAGRSAELERKVGAAVVALSVASDALQGAQEAPDVPTAEREAGAARAALEAASTARGRLSGLRESTTAAAARLEVLEEQREPLEADVADWTLIGQSLGRDGIQAALIDAAGPELTELINDLLHTCVGPRWSIEVRTQRSKASGKGEREVLDLIVVDTVEGREGEISTYSGGECVILGEAVSLALATLARRRAGTEDGSTIVRDESGAALDEERTEQWVAMVRRAAELVGASRVLLVTHNARAAGLCDSRLVVGDRAIRVLEDE